MRALRILAASIVIGLWCVTGCLFDEDKPESASHSVPTITLEAEDFERIVPADGYLKAETATEINGPPGSGPLRIAWLAENGSTVEEGDVVVRFDQEEFKRKLADGKAASNAASAKLQSQYLQGESSVQGRTSAAELAQMDLELSRRRAGEATDEIFSRHEILNFSIDGALSEARVEHAEKATVIDQSINRSKVELLRIERKAGELAVQRAQKGLERMEMRAPHGGVFVYARDGIEPGIVVHSGWGIGLLPQTETMEAEVFVLEADALGLEEGKSATVVIESRPEASYQATIKSVGALAQPRQRDVPIQYFMVVLAFEQTDTAVMKPGQRVRASLKLDASRAIVVPRQCLFEIDNSMVVYRLADGKFEPVEVTLGHGTPGRVVIEEGVEEGDVIATLNPLQNPDPLGGTDEG